MQQKWWLIVAGVLGIGLAILLFPKPDTGADVPPPDPANTDPLNFKDQPEGPAPAAPPRVVRKAGEPRPESAVKGANPAAAARLEATNTPEAIIAGRASGPWTLVRRQLIQAAGDEQALALAEEISPVILGLRELRSNPEAGDYASLEAQQKALVERVKANPEWTKDEVMGASLQRIEALFDEYAQAKAGGGVAAPPQE